MTQHRFHRKFYATREQLVYAKVLDMGMKIGLGTLLVTFALYMSGVLDPHVPLADLPRYWGLSLGDYLAATGVGTGWSWFTLVGTGDYVNMVGICFLAGVTIACYGRILIYPLKKKDILFAAMLAMQVLVLALGASGILVAGH
ncbi:MAG: hypothetical protein HQL35_10805 [Alphaproteobacteria bacterium]|nr:hypothetical protein [Alphaproteobacteria bacterium]